MRSIMLNFEAWLQNKNGIGNQEEKQVLSQIRLFFEKYGASRFQYISDGIPSYDRPPSERAGYRTRRSGELLFYVFKSYFEEVIARGLELRFVKMLLRDRGILETDNDRKRFDKAVRIEGNLVRLYVINNKIFEGD